jgi:hypothetical protein
MPVKRKTRTNKRKQGGKGLFDTISNAVKNAVAELKRGKYISKAAKFYGNIPLLPHSGLVGSLGNIAEQNGFGKKRRTRKTSACACPKGKGLQLASGLKLSGSGLQLARGRKPKRKSGKGLTLSGGSLVLAGSGRLKRKTVFP